MFFIKSALEALEMPGRPFLHDVNHQLPVTGEPAKPVRYAIESPSPRPRRNEDDGGARRDRTDDLMLAKHALYQLSYGPIRAAR